MTRPATALTVTITNGSVRIDEHLKQILSFFPWHVTAHGYVATAIGTKKLMMHRLIMGATNPNDLVDHINGDKTDNRLVNLRFATKGQNSQNAKKPRATSGYIGVSSYNGYHVAYIKKHGKRHHLGMFKDPLEAALRYDEEAVKLYGPQARTNLRHFTEIIGRLKSGKKTRNKV